MLSEGTRKKGKATPGARKHRRTTTLSDRLRVKREEKGWSQERLACEAKTSRKTIQRIENGEIPYPRNIEAIARALEVSPWWLMFRIRPLSPPR